MPDDVGKIPYNEEVLYESLTKPTWWVPKTRNKEYKPVFRLSYCYLLHSCAFGGAAESVNGIIIKKNPSDLGNIKVWY